MSSRITTRAMTAVASSSNAGATAMTSNNAKTSKDQNGRANTTKGKSKKRQKTHHLTTVDAMPDPRAPKKARCGYELFLLSGGVELQVGNIIKKVVSVAS